jgi:hypothetical protein
MTVPLTRREFLTEVGRGMVIATVGYEVASQLGLASTLEQETAEALSFGTLEPLVCLMQETPVQRLLPTLVDRLHSGTDLRQLTAAAALANARTFGGEDYVGFHTMMALAPALHIAQELPVELQPLPVLKVLYRNTNRIQEAGGRKAEVLHPVTAAATLGTGSGGELLREAVRDKNVERAEQTFARLASGAPEDAFNDLLVALSSLGLDGADRKAAGSHAAAAVGALLCKGRILAALDERTGFPEGSARTARSSPSLGCFTGKSPGRRRLGGANEPNHF